MPSLIKKECGIQDSLRMVCAIVVTHNRRSYLCTLLNVLVSLDVDVLVVDNASSDETSETLRFFRSIHVLYLSKNRGGSGGFVAGIRWACAKGYQWLWLMDDDVVPLPGALEVFAAYAKPGACLNPSKLTAAGKIFEFEGKIDWRTLKRRRLPHAQVFQNRDIVPCNTACFEGLFVDAHLAESLLTPWQNFFIAWDDILFGMLASKAGTNLYLKQFCIQKQFDREKPFIGKWRYHSSLFGRYFHLRNFCLVRNYLRRHGLGGDRARLQFAYEWLKALILTLVIEHNPKGVWFLFLAWWHGTRGDVTTAQMLFPSPQSSTAGK